VSEKNFSTSITVDQSADEVFRAVTDVAGWWTGDVEGPTAALGDEFTYRYRELHYSRQRVTELVPGVRVTWRVVDAHLAFTGDPAEWVGTEIRFEIAPRDGGTELRFTHVGLDPELECFDQCSSAWSFFVAGSLRRLITIGDGPTEPPWAA
jgi:uncharacterized protein YndB with AHSA1/START domain